MNKKERQILIATAQLVREIVSKVPFNPYDIQGIGRLIAYVREDLTWVPVILEEVVCGDIGAAQMSVEICRESLGERKQNHLDQDTRGSFTRNPAPAHTDDSRGEGS